MIKKLKPVMFMVSSILGCGAFVLSSSLYKFGNISLLYLFIATLMFMGLAYIFAEFGKDYLITTKKHAPLLTKISFWIYWVGSCMSTAVILNEIILCLQSVGIIGQNAWLATLIKISLLLFITAINSNSQKQSLYVETAITILKSSVLILLPILIIFKSKKLTLSSSMNYPFSLKSMIKCIVCSGFSFLGVETGAIVAEEKSTNFQKWSMVIAILLCGIIYMLNVYAVYLSRINPITPTVFNDISMKYFGSIGSNVMAGIITFISIGSLNSWIFAAAAVGEEGGNSKIMPNWFTKKNQMDVPINSLWVSSGILGITAICFSGRSSELDLIINLCTISCIIFYGIVSYAYGKEYNSTFGYFMALIQLMFLVFILYISLV